MMERFKTNLLKVRIAQIRLCSDFFRWIGRRDWMARHIQDFAESRFGARCAGVLVGPRRTFQTLKEAERASQRYIRGGHSSDRNAEIHLNLLGKPRPSDYPAFYHLQKIAPQLKQVVDWGGNCGNVYYSWQSHLEFDDHLTWTVFDLPKMIEVGRRVASERCEHRLEFVSTAPYSCEPDLLLASGSLHYFEDDLASIVSRFASLPKHILINRTPMTDRQTFATVQDAGAIWVPCIVRSHADVVSGLEQLGYRHLDTWEVAELSIPLPMHPRNEVTAYSGAFFGLA